MRFIKPIVFFDLETTGTSTTSDRIVQIAAAKLQPSLNGEIEIKKVLVNPGMPIPPGATKVHGITNEMVKDKPTFASYAKSLFELMSGCNLAGFNIRTFDVPLLAEEFSRVGIDFPEPGMCYFDSCRIFHSKEPRDLSAAVRFYTGSELTGAHDAGADVVGTIEVFRAQMKKYTELQDMDEKQLDLFCTGGKNVLDLAGKIAINDDGVPVYTFGKAIGKPVSSDKGFGEWMLKGDFNTDTKNVLKKLLYAKK